MHQRKKNMSNSNNRYLVISDVTLTSLEGSPDVVGVLIASGIRHVTSLVGGPKEVGGKYSFTNGGLTSLDGIPVKIGGYLDLSNNPLTSLHGINKLKEMKGNIYLGGCPITSHILGVFFIKGCTGIVTSDNFDFVRKVATIVNGHISKGRSGLLTCQQELIDAGLADFAKI
jgi:hypothetical protein